MKRSAKKLQFSPTTVKPLDNRDLEHAAGAGTTYPCIKQPYPAPMPAPQYPYGGPVRTDGIEAPRPSLPGYPGCQSNEMSC